MESGDVVTAQDKRGAAGSAENVCLRCGDTPWLCCNESLKMSSLAKDSQRSISDQSFIENRCHLDVPC